MAGHVYAKCIEVKNVWMLDFYSMSIYLCIRICVWIHGSLCTRVSTHVHNLAVSISDVWFMYSCVICPGLRRWSLRTWFAFPHTLLSCASYIPALIWASRWESLNSSTLNIFLLQRFERILGIWEGACEQSFLIRKGAHIELDTQLKHSRGSLSWLSCFFWGIPCMLILPRECA